MTDENISNVYIFEKINDTQVVPGTNLIIVDTYWFTPGSGMTTIGVVLTEDVNMGYRKAYIGTGSDATLIAAYGAKVSRKFAESIFGQIEVWKN